jgi:hypothetical protein
VNRPRGHRLGGTLVSAHLSHSWSSNDSNKPVAEFGVWVLSDARVGSALKLAAGTWGDHSRGVLADGSGEAA